MRKQQGFTLIELIIVVTLIGILAAIAVPSYIEHTTKARRTEAQTALLSLASRMERYFSENNTYATATLGTGNAVTDVLSSDQTQEAWYVLSISASGVSSYTIQATPQNAQATDDKQCQSLTYNSLGQRGIANGPAGAPTGTVTACW